MRRARTMPGILLGIAVAVAGCSTHQSSLRETAPRALAKRYPAYLGLEKEFKEASLQNVAILSPGFFDRARSGLERARGAVQSEAGSIKVGEAVTQASGDLLKARIRAEGTRRALADVLEARGQALRVSAGAAEYSAADRKLLEETFQRGERQFRDLAEMIEAGRLSEVLLKTGPVVRTYLDCRRSAEANRTLGAARLVLDQAGREGAAELVPGSFSAAQNVVGRAERFAAVHPGAYNELPRRTREAYFYANRTLRETQAAERALPPLPAVSMAE